MSETGSGPEGAAAADGPQQPQVALQKIFLKDMSFESPNSPDVFRRPWKPKHQLDLNSRFRQVGDDLYEVVLTISIEARDEEDKVGFIVELQQAGIFVVTGLADGQLQHAMSTYAPTVLFPYARETIDALVTRGAFPALMLAPVNFDALYAEALRRQGGPGEAGPLGGGSAVDGGAVSH
jgi:preprotein translocase subunit SecB